MREDLTAFSKVILEMQLLAAGSVTAYNSTGHSTPSSREPTGGDAPWEEWLERWERATGPITRGKVLNAAREALERFRKAPKVVQVVPESQAQLEARVVSEGAGWTVEEVARHCRCTVSFVRKARANSTIASAVDNGEKQQRVRELAAEGLTERQIGFLTQVPKGTIRRLLGRAA